MERLCYGEYGTKPTDLQQILAAGKHRVAKLREELIPPLNTRIGGVFSDYAILPDIQITDEREERTQKEIDRLIDSASELKKLLDLNMIVWDTQNFERWAEQQAKQKNCFYNVRWENHPFCYYYKAVPDRILLLAENLIENLISPRIRELSCWRTRRNKRTYHELPVTKFLVWEGRLGTYPVAYWDT